MKTISKLDASFKNYREKVEEIRLDACVCVNRGKCFVDIMHIELITSSVDLLVLKQTIDSQMFSENFQ